MTRIRWLPVALYVVGWFLTVGQFPNFLFEYTLLSALSSVGCVLLLTFLDGPLGPNLPIWLGLAVFWVNHYLKFYAIVIDPELLHTPPILGLVGTVPPSEETLFATYAAITYGFVPFAIVSTLFAISGRRVVGRLANPGPEVLAGRRIRTAIVIPAILALGLAGAKLLMASIFNFTRGRETWLIATLPFHMVAIVEILMASVISLLGLYVLEAGLRTRSRITASAGLAILLLDAGADMIFMGSKSSLARAAMLLAFFWIVTGRRVRLQHVVFFAVCGLISAALYPFIIAFRYMRAANLSVPVSSAMKLVAQTGSDPNFRFGTVRLIFMRLTGADMVLALIDHHVARISSATLWASGMYADHYASLEIFGAPVGPDHRPTFVVMLTPVGLFYLRGGNAGVILGMLAFTALVLGAWRWLWSRRDATRSAFCAFFLVTLFWRLMEGDLEYQVCRALPLYILAGVVVEFVLRIPSGPRVAARPIADPLAQGDAELTPV